jgi:hypothetical protein
MEATRGAWRTVWTLQGAAAAAGLQPEMVRS